MSDPEKNKSWTLPCWSATLDTTTRTTRTAVTCCTDRLRSRWMPQNSTMGVLCHLDAWTTFSSEGFAQHKFLSRSLLVKARAWALTASWMRNHQCAKLFTRPRTCPLCSPSKATHQQPAEVEPCVALGGYETSRREPLWLQNSHHSGRDRSIASEELRQPCRSWNHTLPGGRCGNICNSLSFQTRHGRYKLGLA